MEKGFRLVQCTGCPKQVRFCVTVAMYGKTGNINCECGARMRVTIPVPADAQSKNAPESPFADAMESAKETFGRIFGDFLDGKKKK